MSEAQRIPWCETQHGVSWRNYLNAHGRNLMRAKLGTLTEVDVRWEEMAFLAVCSAGRSM